ncbi:MAG: hypothetical protein ACJ76F_00605 [Bacteroidia bacterium]
MRSAFVFLILSMHLSCFSQSQEGLCFEIGPRAYTFRQGIVKSGLGLNVEKFISNEFSMNYHLSAGTVNTGFNRNAFTAHMPVGSALGCLLAASIFSTSHANNNSLSLIPYCFIIPEGISYYPVRNDQVEFGLTADLLGINYTSEKSMFMTSKFSYQQNFGMVFKMNTQKHRYLAARLGYQIDFYSKNTLRGFNGSILIGFRDHP